MLTAILSLLGKIVADVMKDLLTTPGTIVDVKDTGNAIDTVATDTDELLDRYKWLHDRG
jgi:hypothetical protein